MMQVDLAPGTYAFALTYNGTRDQKTVTITGHQANQTVYFHTMLVNVELQAHDNSALDIPANGSASYYAGGWHAITTGTRIIPLSYRPRCCREPTASR